MIGQDLFGTVRLVRNWGRIGTKGQELVEIHADEMTGRPECSAQEDRATLSSQSFDEAIIIRLGAQDGKPAAPALSGSLDEHLVAVFGDVDCYQSGRSRCRIELGHGRLASSVCSATSL
jgi:hypothetical protein